MALDNARLGSAIATALQNARPGEGVTLSDADLETLWQNIAAEIVNEIKNNGEVTVQTSDGPATGTIQ